MRALSSRISASLDCLMEKMLTAWLWFPFTHFQKPSRLGVPIIASLTSYPPRIRYAWIAIETLLRQSVRPLKIILVLNVVDFPNGKIPRKLLSQGRRGLSIVWVKENGRSYDKILPVITAYPEETIVTFDDDKFFPPNLLQALFSASLNFPDTIIGSRGWEIKKSPGRDELHYGQGWKRAQPGSHGKMLFTPGGNGCLYPAGSLHESVRDLGAALSYCPTADDIWLWGAAVKNGTKFHCLGLPAHRPVARQKPTPALSDINSTENDRQFQKVIDVFSIRAAVQKNVP